MIAVRPQTPALGVKAGRVGPAPRAAPLTGVCLGQGTGSPLGWAMLGAALGLWLPQAIPPMGCCPAPLWGEAERLTVPILNLVRVPQGPDLALEPKVWPNFCSRPMGPHAALPTPEASGSAHFVLILPVLFLEALSWAQKVGVHSPASSRWAPPMPPTPWSPAPCSPPDTAFRGFTCPQPGPSQASLPAP